MYNGFTHFTLTKFQVNADETKWLANSSESLCWEPRKMRKQHIFCKHIAYVDCSFLKKLDKEPMLCPKIQHQTNI